MFFAIILSTIHLHTGFLRRYFVPVFTICSLAWLGMQYQQAYNDIRTTFYTYQVEQADFETEQKRVADLGQTRPPRYSQKIADLRKIQEIETRDEPQVAIPEQVYQASFSVVKNDHLIPESLLYARFHKGNNPEFSPLIPNPGNIPGIETWTHIRLDSVQLYGQIMANITNRKNAHLYANPPKSKHGLSSWQCMAVAAYHESRGEGVFSMMSVPSVMMQRAVARRAWGDTICKTMVFKGGFSFMQGQWDFPRIKDMNSWAKAVEIALAMRHHGPLEDLALVDHYVNLKKEQPSWRFKMDRIALIGDHTLYSDYETRRRAGWKLYLGGLFMISPPARPPERPRRDLIIEAALH